MKSHLKIPAFLAALFFSSVSHAQFPNLRSVTDFALFTTTGAVGNTGTSTITGKIGTNDGDITGFTPVPGQQENANTITATAASDLQLAYDEIRLAAHSLPALAAVLGNGDTITPGVYLIAEAASIEGILFLDAEGDADAVFIFKIEGAFSPGPSSQIQLIGDASACNVYWAVEGGAIAFATLAEMKGNFIANPGAVSMAASSELEGRLLSTTGAVAVDGVIVSLPVCGGPLPVTLLNFKASRNNAVVELSWTVENEVSFAGYELERSAEVGSFIKIGSLPSNNASFLQTYKWIDHSPFAVMNLYRLKMIDIDGNFKYSSILRINMGARKSMLVYPNPVIGHSLMVHMYGQPKAFIHQMCLRFTEKK